MATPFMAKVIGIPHIPSINRVNVRSGPGATRDRVFQISVGSTNLRVIEVQIDEDGRNLFGKTYHWLRCQFPFGLGWIRDDLIEVVGDGREFGYPLLTTAQIPFNLTRVEPTSVAPVAPMERTSVPPTAASAAPDTANPIVEPPQVTTTVPVSNTGSQSAPAMTVPTGTPMAICNAKSGVNIYSEPATNHSVITRFQYRATGDILDSTPGEDGNDFIWVKIRFQGREGWVREDFLRYTGAFGAIGLSHTDMYTNPVPRGWWLRDYDPDGSRIGVAHHGWDIGGDIGFAILAGASGGQVVDTRFCASCGGNGLSAVDKGFALNDSRVLSSDSWNYGYGHFVIVRYTHDLLPASTQSDLSRRGFANAHLFVMYAHVQDMLVSIGQEVDANQQIATLGNSGNSSTAHLHLEVRAHGNASETSWARIRDGLMTPSVLFLR